MKLILTHLSLWLAPILCFTAEEAWQAHYGEEAPSIHLQTFQAIPPYWQNEALAKKWTEIRSLRRVITGALERARAEKRIGTPLQAHLHVFLTPELAQLVENIDLAEISICSAVTTHIDQPPSDAFTLVDMPAVGVVVTLAEGKKCERCWQILREVGHQPHASDLCVRCDDVVTFLRR